MNSNTLHHFHLLSVSEAGEDAKAQPVKRISEFSFYLPHCLHDAHLGNQSLRRGTKLRYPRLHASNQRVSKAKWRIALTLNRPTKDTSAVTVHRCKAWRIESWQSQFLENRQRNQFRNLQKPFFKALQPSLKMDLQISYREKENALQKVYSQSFWYLNATRDTCADTSGSSPYHAQLWKQSTWANYLALFLLS